MTRHAESSPRKLTPRQEAFCLHFVLLNNGAKAAREAGYSAKGADRQAEHLLRNIEILTRVEELKAEREERLKFNADEILKNLSIIARGTMKDYLRVDENGNVSLNLQDLTQEQLYCIKELKITERFEGKGDDRERIVTTHFKLEDKVKALALAGNHVRVGAFRHLIQAEISNKYKDMEDPELDAQIEARENHLKSLKGENNRHLS